MGFDYSAHVCRSAKRNMRSARERAGVITSYLQEERARRRIVDAPGKAGNVQVSPFGVIPKSSQPGKWRLILDLSSPRGSSVNDGINPQLCTLSYARVDDVAQRVRTLGRGTLLAKLDILSAYRIIPVHPDDRNLFGMRWQGVVCLDAALPFGLRSAPKIFSAVADALLWVMFKNGVTSGLHYLDDFLFSGAPGSDECALSLARALETCRELGIPVAWHKLVGPSTVLTFLGIEIDTMTGQLRLPGDKLARLNEVLSVWSERRCCTKRELLSLIGTLHHAAVVVRPGRVFLRRLIDLSMIPKGLHHFVRLNSEARSDILWWKSFAERWNGVGMLESLGYLQPSTGVRSDASGRWGCGAVYQQEWLQLRWSPKLARLGIAAKEAMPVVLAACCWGRHWAGQHVVFEVDNSTVVEPIRSGTCRDAGVMRLLRMLHFIAAEWSFTYTSKHIPGAVNTVADAISRNLLASMSSLQPQLARQPVPVPLALVQLLEETDLDWTSTAWRTQFLDCLRRA